MTEAEARKVIESLGLVQQHYIQYNLQNGARVRNFGYKVVCDKKDVLTEEHKAYGDFRYMRQVSTEQEVNYDECENVKVTSRVEVVRYIAANTNVEISVKERGSNWCCDIEAKGNANLQQVLHAVVAEISKYSSPVLPNMNHCEVV